MAAVNSKTLWRFLYVIAFFVPFLFPVFVHRQGFDQAMFAWHHNPTPTTEAALRIEARKDHKVELEVHIVAGLLLVAGIAGLSSAIQFAKR